MVGDTEEIWNVNVISSWNILEWFVILKDVGVYEDVCCRSVKWLKVLKKVVWNGKYMYCSLPWKTFLATSPVRQVTDQAH